MDELLKSIVNKVEEYENFDDGIGTVGMLLKSPIDHNTIMAGLTEMTKQIHELSKFHVDDQKNEFTLSKDNGSGNKQLFLRISNGTRIYLYWDFESDMNLGDLVIQVFDILESNFSIFPINISYIDFQLVIGTDCELNQMELIQKVFYKESTFDEIFEPNKIGSNNISYKGMIDSISMAAISINSGHSIDDIEKDNLKGKTLIASCGIAQISDISLTEKLSVTTKNHITKSVSYLLNSFLPTLVSPINDYVKNLTN